MITKRDMMLGAAALPVFAPSLSFAQNAADVFPMPFEMTPLGCPVIPVRIRGQGPYRFALSTAGTRAYIRESLAETLGLQRSRTSATERDGAKETAYGFNATDVNIGGLFNQSGMAFMGMRYNSPYDGILPANIVTGMTTEIDFDARVIRYYPKGFVELPGYVKVPSFQRTDFRINRVFVESEWQGEKINLMLDTYGTSEVIFDAPTVKKLKLWDKFGGSDGEISNSETFETRKVRYASNQALTFGSLGLERLTLSLTDPEAKDTRAGGGSLSGKGLHRFNILFGGLKGLYFKPNSFTAPWKNG